MVLAYDCFDTCTGIRQNGDVSYAYRVKSNLEEGLGNTIKPKTKKKMNKKYTIHGLLAASLIGSSHAALIFSSNFTGSTADTSATTTPSGQTVTTAANLNAGTTVGTWDAPSSTVAGASSQSSGVLVSSGISSGMTGNWLMVGGLGNTDPFGSTGTQDSIARFNLSSTVSLNGTSISMAAKMFDTGGQPGGMFITGYDAGGAALFQAVMGTGGTYTQGTISSMVTAGGALNNSSSQLWTNGVTNTVDFTLGAAGYSVTADGGTTTVAGSYFGTGDLASIELHAFDSKSNFGIDNITVNGVPEPSSVALLGLGGLALILRRRK